MPVYSRTQIVTAIQADRDFSILCDWGHVRGKAGDYLLITEERMLYSYTAEEFTNTWGTPIQQTETTDTDELALLAAIKRGRW